VRSGARDALSGQTPGATAGRRASATQRYLSLQLAAASLEDDVNEQAATAMLTPVRSHSHTTPQDLSELLRHAANDGEEFERAKQWWRSIASDEDAAFDDEVEIRAGELKPVVTWGVNPGQSIAIDERVPSPDEAEEPQAISDALDYMGLEPGRPIAGMKVDVAFIGSCTNARLSDLREAARIVKGRHVAPHVKALVVPGSVGVGKAAEREGLADIFRAAGFEWRGAGCSMCLGMNPDKLQGNQVCAASSNRNFKGRQGSPTGRTLLMSPAMVAAAAVAGEVVDVREYVS
jgi:3-isopropylmalate/(R)-2-methylmalate dehydratase large subunit